MGPKQSHADLRYIYYFRNSYLPNRLVNFMSLSETKILYGNSCSACKLFVKEKASFLFNIFESSCLGEHCQVSLSLYMKLDVHDV